MSPDTEKRVSVPPPEPGDASAEADGAAGWPLDVPPGQTRPSDPGCRILAGLLLAACAALLVVLVMLYRNQQSSRQAVVGTWQAVPATAPNTVGLSALSLGADGSYTATVYVAQPSRGGLPQRVDVAGRWTLAGARLLLEEDHSMGSFYAYNTQSPTSLDLTEDSAGRHLHCLTSTGKTLILTQRRGPARHP